MISYVPTEEAAVTSQDNFTSLLFTSSPLMKPSIAYVNSARASPYILVAEFAVTVASFLAIVTVIFDDSIEL